MTTKTRRRVLLAAMLVAFTLPAEIVLLRAFQDAEARAEQWVASLDQTELSAAASSIQDYPFAYRKQIMANLSPTARASVWQSHVGQYLNQHRELDAEMVDAITAARALITPRLLSDPTDDDRAAMIAAAERVDRLIGQEAAHYLFYYLGPRDSNALANASPVIDRLAAVVRDQFVVRARQNDCGCSTSWGCGGYNVCTADGTDCSMVVVWPMCGWMWSQPCDGVCMMW